MVRIFNIINFTTIMLIYHVITAYSSLGSFLEPPPGEEEADRSF